MSIRRNPDCDWCDGEGEIEVVAVRDAQGREHRLPDISAENKQTGVVAPCPPCNGTGDVLEPDDPRVP